MPPQPSPAALEERLAAIVGASTWFMPALRAVQGLGLASWCIGAGAVRNLVWDVLHRHERPSFLSDVDVAYFDRDRLDPERDAELQRQLAATLPGLPWEVTNQAAVHTWFENCFGHAVAPLRSLDEAVASWPEYATSVGVYLRQDHSIGVIAPYGLQDLFGMVVRRNPARVSVATYRERIERKRYPERWPRVTIIPA
ncbi:nucleotidyltransferase family protein [Aquabacterium sp. A7-Y]|uniref:nucleotidyltransferase family protein n=1 Tax=Aquabacterium sp. A7-Y TaxID=1349605 RepID=UPI00223DA3C5|nr:nucleotidyltransferase family protein [Aquabacterium sp. A7-Y]MCW7536555.1 nucleotidyltransferase family protein [Aquabacterium sp. A7-Y]